MDELSKTKPKETYLDKLRSSAEKTGSIVCFGIDPVIEALPGGNPSIASVHPYIANILMMLQRRGYSPAAFKPNQGFFIKHDYPMVGQQAHLQAEERHRGSSSLAEILYHELGAYFPDIPIILDFKRGDIATSSDNYATEGFVCWGADAVTVNPYMGSDSVMPFIKHTANGKGVYILNRTSNPGAKDFQDLDIYMGMRLPFGETETSKLAGIPQQAVTKKLYECVAEKIIEWSQGNPGVGAVVGATSLDELEKLAALYAGKDIPLLIPGVGGQGGSAKDVADVLRRVGYDLRLARINSSSGLTHPWKKPPVPEDYASRCINEFVKLNEEIGPLQ
jgi:orotidine-5'-phosphate decarboxylase